MSLQNVYAQIRKLGSTPSKNDKVELLKVYLKDPLFQKVSTFTLDSRRTYNVKVFPQFNTVESAGVPDQANQLLDFLDSLNTQSGSTKLDKDKLFSLAAIDEATYELTKLICTAGFKCGCSVKSFNKALMGSIFYIPYCRCSTETKLHMISWPAFAQEKADGTFTNMIVSKAGKIKFLTRDGNKLKQLGKLKKRILKNLPERYYGNVFQGELLIPDPDGNIMNRQTGNGIITSCQYDSADQAVVDETIMRLWDIIPLDDFWAGASKIEYFPRYNNVVAAASEVAHSCFTVVETKVVTCLAEVHEFYKYIRSLGGEGLITKDFKALWKDHTSPLQCKMKNVMDVEMDITNVYMGEPDSKYEKCLGGLGTTSGCGMITVNVGGGFSDAQRGYIPVSELHPKAIKAKDNDFGFTDPETGEYYPPLYIDSKAAKDAIEYWENEMGSGAVAGLECESVSYSKSKSTYSLYLPRFDMLRTNKKADTFEGLKERGACENIKAIS